MSFDQNNRISGAGLHLAGAIIGWLNMIFSLIQVIICITIIGISEIVAVYVCYHIHMKFDLQLSKFINSTITMIAFLHLALSIQDFLASSLLILGIARKSPPRILPWLVNSSFVLLVKIPMISAVFTKDLDPTVEMVAGVLVLSYLGIFSFSWITIFTIYRSSQKRQNIISDIILPVLLDKFKSEQKSELSYIKYNELQNESQPETEGDKVSNCIDIMNAQCPEENDSKPGTDNLITKMTATEPGCQTLSAENIQNIEDIIKSGFYNDAKSKEGATLV